MNRVLILITLTFISCKEESSNNTSINQEVIDKGKTQTLVIENKLLNGVWAENEEDNAVFEINKDTLRYIEFYGTPYKLIIKNNRFIVKDSSGFVFPESEIVKLTTDSLLLKSSHGSISKFYKRRY